ncbi:hybrid sensor histidine kinase/response regulator [Hymenobacter negativus]|uniref:histidine kinase n=1 Tax=Hymenobacter negativus TaxID=2795026 RepID=A0ABS3QHH0_9BACT|nr:hybrid sensor histidine kinase/response regulator [Hymenobacter negativus]MBO2010566.1 response regulator [Hymenobacter negativus]
MKSLLHFLYLRRPGLLLLAALGLSLFLTRPASAQQVYLRQFGPAEGFRPSFVYALLQDRQGYLWLGTGEGLVRYDGTQFTTFTQKDGLTDDFVVSLREDPASGRLWVGHYQGGISVKAAASNSFSSAKRSIIPAGLHLPADGTPPVDTAAIGRYQRRYHVHLPAGTEAICLLEDREGNAWLGTAGQGLWRHSDRYLRLDYTDNWDASVAPALTTVYQHKQAQAWATSFGNHFFQLKPTAEPQIFGSPRLLPLPLGNSSVKVLLAKRGGGFWLGTAVGLWHTSSFDKPAVHERRLPANLSITALAHTTKQGLWVGTADDGIYLLPTDTAQRIRHFTTANGLLHNTIYALLADRNGRVWVATHGTGIGSYDPVMDEFAHYRLGSGGLDATSLAEDADGRLWVGTEGQSLYCRQRSGQWQQLTAQSKLPSDYTYGILPLPAASSQTGPQLLLVHRQGLTLLDARTHRFTALAAADDPLVRELLGPIALTAKPKGHAVAWLTTRAGMLRVDVNAARRLADARPPGLAFTLAEVDGEPRAVGTLGWLSAARHRLNFNFQGISLNSGEPLTYQYRLRGLSDAWSRPSSSGEAQFPSLDAGQYVMQARVRRGSAGPWSPVATAAFGIATPFWRTWWFRAFAVLGLTGLIFGVVRAREGSLRRTQLVLERTVRERTAELRQQKAQIEVINADLVVARDAAESSRRAKAQFLANMSHEIRTPMNAVIGLTNLLQATRPTQEQGEYLTAIESSSQNLLVIINDILDSSKMEAGKLTLEQVPFRLPEAVRRLGAMFKFATESKGLFFKVNVADNVPAAVLGDPVRLNQVLVNLVGNAIKFTRHGGVTVTVEAVETPDLANPSAPQLFGHSRVRFAVRDTGIGIPNDKLGAIFEDFSQANTSTTREFGGTGLGLSIARNLVQLHGGQLGVTSEEGQGSEFFFELPYEVADASAAQPDAHAGLLTPFEPALRVLVAEDNALNQLVARKTLEAWNVQVVIAENGRLALEAVTEANALFDAVFMDVQMPEMDGYEAARQIRQHFPGPNQLPIIGLTASVLPEDRALALAAGMNDTLAKPFEPAVLYARLAYFTGRTGPGQEGAEVGMQAGTVADSSTPTPAPPPSSPHTLIKPDWHLLEELAGGNEGFLRQIINTFLTEAPALEALLAATYPTDPPALASTAHKLKGQVAYFGVPVLHTQLDELERAAKHPAMPYCEPLLDTIRHQLAELYPQLEERAGT